MITQFHSAFARLTAAVLLAACSAKPNAKTTPDSTKSSGGDVSKPAAVPKPSKHTADKPPARPAPDSARPRLNSGRNAHDSASYVAAIRAGQKRLANWPTGPERVSGSLLPENRIVAYYGNPHSKKMGVLGEYPEQEMLSMLDKTVAQWRTADPATPVIPAIHLVTGVAQGDAGSDCGRSRRCCSSISSGQTCTSASIPSSTCTTSARVCARA